MNLIQKLYQFRRSRNDINGGHGSAVSLQLIGVGKRHCRVLYINSGAAGIDIIRLLSNSRFLVETGEDEI